MIRKDNVSRGLVCGLVLTLGLTAGCQQQQASNEKQARLLAAQNVELEGRLAGLQAQIEVLKQQCAEKLQAKENELAQCKARNEGLQKDLQQGIAVRVKDVTDTVMNENVRLREENAALKADNERLKADVGRLQEEVERLRDEAKPREEP